MPVSAPSIDFVKADCGKAWGTSIGNVIASLQAKTALGAADWNISYDPSAQAGGIGAQSGNWAHRAAEVAGETNLWASLPGGSGISSGMGFIPAGSPTEPHLLQGEVSAPINFVIFNNFGQVDPNPGGSVGYAVAENCKLKVFDSPVVNTQSLEPISNVSAAPNIHGFWLQVRQLGYWYGTGVGGGSLWLSDAAKPITPYCIGGSNTNVANINFRYPAGAGPNYDPIPARAIEPFLSTSDVTGIGYFPVGSQTKSYIGCNDAYAGNMADGNKGGCVEIQARVLVPADATAMFHKFALAVQYTFVVA